MIVIRSPRVLREVSRRLSVVRSSSSGVVGSVGSSNGGLVLGSSVLIGLGGALKFVHDEMEGMEGLMRTVSFYSLAIPKYIEYRWYSWAGKSEDEWEELHERTSLEGLEKILELGGFYIKSGQLCAANIGNAFPPIWQRTMSVLQDDCPFQPLSVIQQILQEEYGRPWQDVFHSIDPVPLGAASIGQVHRAVLKDTMEDVVVKIMYPNVESIFRGDVRTIKLFCQIAQPVHVPALEEMEHQFMTEFDYRSEAQQMAKVHANLTAAGIAATANTATAFNQSPPLCQIPKPYLDKCTKRVLVMTPLQGQKLPTVLQSQPKPPSNITDQQQLIQHYQQLEAKRRMQNIISTFYNIAIASWYPNTSKRQYQTRLDYGIPTIDPQKLIHDLIYIHGHEVLVDGYFNGDPHPGNIFIMDPTDHKFDHHQQQQQLGLIDYGQVKHIDKPTRLLLCQLIIALANQDQQEVVNIMKQAGYQSKYMDTNVIYTFARVSYDEDNDQLTGGKHIQFFLEDLQSQDPIQKLPQDFIMVGRTSTMLRGLAHALKCPVSVAKAWKPIAQSVLEKEQTYTMETES